MCLDFNPRFLTFEFFLTFFDAHTVAKLFHFIVSSNMLHCSLSYLDGNAAVGSVEEEKCYFS